MTTRVLKLYRIQDEVNIDILCDNFHDYDRQTTRDPDNVRVFYKADTSTTPSWKSFIADAVVANAAILEEENTRSESFVCFLKSNESNWFAITGGFGHHKIQASCDKNFGTDILVRLIEETDQSLLSAKEKSVTGNSMARANHFRTSSRFLEYKRFGAITNSLEARITPEQAQEAFPSLGVEEEQSVKVSAGPSLQVRVSINFDTLVNLIENCETVLARDPAFVVNSIIPIKRSTNSALIELLEAELQQQLWNLYNQAPDAYPFDICHTDFELYLSSSSVKLLRKKDGQLIDFLRRRGNDVAEQNARELGSLRSGSELFDLMRTQKTRASSPSRLWGQLKSLIIRTYSDPGGLQTEGKFLDHYMGDVSLGNEKYFLVDKRWYQLESSFLDRLNDTSYNVLNSREIDLDLRNWPDEMSEGEYNASYLGSQNTLVVDRLLFQNIEVCDIVKWDDDNLYLIHVKKGFGNTLRELCNQIAISASRITEGLQSAGRREFLQSVYNAFSGGGGQTDYFLNARAQFENISFDEFVRLFEKNIYMVLAVKDERPTQRDFTDMSKYRSAIGKFSIVELGEKMALQNPTLAVSRILR